MAVMSNLFLFFWCLTVVLACSTTTSTTKSVGHPHHRPTATSASVAQAAAPYQKVAPKKATPKKVVSTTAAPQRVAAKKAPRKPAPKPVAKPVPAPDGLASIDNNGVMLAPQPTDPVPDDVALYTPSGNTVDMTDFFYWRQGIRDKNSKGQGYTSRFLKIAPGSYGLTWTEQEHNTMDVTFWTGEDGNKGWTLDLRGVTIQYDVGPTNPGAPNPFFYVNQAPPTFTILGGSIFQYTGEIWSQATVTSVVDNPSAGFDMRKITAKLHPGYDLSAWQRFAAAARKNRAPPDLGCMDQSNPDHWVRVDCNNWYMNFDTPQVSDDGTITFSVTSRGNYQVGYVISVKTGNEMATTLVNEENHGLTVRGLTCNGGFTHIGRDTSGPPRYEDVLVANPPLPAGLGPRANGPTMSQGHIDNFLLCEFGPCDTYQNSFWMYTGNPKDLAVLEEGARIPPEPS